MLAPPKMKSLGINVTNYVPQTLIGEIKEDLNKRSTTPCARIRILSVVKIQVLPKLNYKFNTISIKIPAAESVAINKRILKFICRGKRLRIVSTIAKTNKED